MTLKEKIENQIKELDKLKGKYYTNEYIKIQIETLNWVLAELKKMTCENCKYCDDCLETIEVKDKTGEEEYYHEAIIYCSKWEEK